MSKWSSGFVPIDLVDPPFVGPVDEIARHRFSFANEQHSVAEPGGWLPDDRTHDFRDCLLGFRWAWTLAASDAANHRRHFEDLWKSWRMEVPSARGAAWKVAVVAERAWTLCNVFERLASKTEVADEVTVQLGQHAKFLRSRRGRTIVGHEHVASLKAQLGLGLLLDEPTPIVPMLVRLSSEVDQQVLADGGHFSRSPSVHCKVLADLIDVAALCRVSELGQVDGLDAAVERMRLWLGTMLMPDGDVPLFGDTTLVGRSRLAALEPAKRRNERLVHLRESGYVVCRPDERLHVVCDIGATRACDQSAQADNGRFSFVAAVDGDRTIVDTGVSTHEGQRSEYERSTAAHNTVEIGEVNQAESATRARHSYVEPTIHAVEDDGLLVVDVSHDGYRRLAGEPVHRRRFEIGDGKIVLCDSVDGVGFHRMFSRLFLAPPIDAEFTEGGDGPDVVAHPFSLIRTTVDGAPVPAWVVYASVATALGDRTACRSVWWELWDDLPQHFVTEIVLEEAGSAL